MRNRPLFSGCLIAFLIISLSIMIGGARFVEDLRPSILEKTIKESASVRLSGQVYDIDVKDNYQILYLKNNSIIYQNESFKESKIIIYDEEKLNIKIGNLVDVTGMITFYEGERNPGNFNQKLYYQKQGICASVWASQVQIIENHVKQLRNILYNFRVKWKEMLVRVLGEEDGAVLGAMLLADKSGMNEETKELYQVNGIGHVLAISGLHLSVIGVGLYKIFRHLSGSFVVGGITGISFLVLYILMIGVSVSVLRALIMFLFRVGADIAGRHYDSMTAFGSAALITVIWQPLCLYDGGFWLSYGAIIAIVFFIPIFEGVPFQGFWASASINIVTLPILLYYFYEVPLYSVFLNIVVVPLMTAVLTCGLAGSLCCAAFIADGIWGIGGIGTMMLEICRMIFRVYEKSCQLFLEFPGARIVAGRPEIWRITIYYMCLMLILIMWRRKVFIRYVPRLLAVILMSLSIFLLFIPNDEQGNVYITVLDVGQGDGIFIRGPEGNTYLIDGGSSDVKKVGKYRIEPFLKSQDVAKLDYVFVSHGDGDHISGISEMIERMKVGVTIKTIVFPDRKVWDENLMKLARIAVKQGIHVVEMKAGTEFTEGEMKISCLAPVDEAELYTGDSNAGSMVIALDYREFDMLFTGDTEAEGEEILTGVLKDEYQGTNWDVLKVAHHGSKNSSSTEFLEVAVPPYSVISAGRENRYGHPHEETVERLTDVGSTILSTQENGAITITTDGKKMKIYGYIN